MVLGPAAPEHEPPQRYDVGDEVDVSIDGSSTNPPYDKGWARGVVAFKVCNVDDEHVKAVLPKKYLRDLPPHMGFAYLVKLHDDKGYAPSHHDDPDFIRATDKKYAHDAPTRFAVGDQVECQVGPDVWHRGTVRERRVPYPGYGRGWTEDGEENKKHAGPKDTVAYNVTPHGVTYDSDDEMSSIMVPADKDCFVRAWDGDEADDSSAGEQANPPVTAAQHETLREAFRGLGSNQIEIPHGGGGGDKESLELARYCAGEMKRSCDWMDSKKFDKAMRDKTVPSNTRTVMYNGETQWDASFGDAQEFGTCATMVKNGSIDVMKKTVSGEVVVMNFGEGSGVMRVINKKELLRVVPRDGSGKGGAEDIIVMSFVES